MNLKDSNGTDSVSVRNWGSINGEKAWLIDMVNARGMRLSVSNYGAAVVSCVVPDRSGIFEDVVLGYDTVQEYQRDPYYTGSVVGRFANRLRGNTVEIGGQQYRLRSANPNYHHHGGTEGFNKKMFSHQIFSGERERGVNLYYRSADGEEGYPGNLDLLVRYSLDDDNNWTVEYEAGSDKPTIINLTQHSYFNLNGHRSGDIADHELMIGAEYFLPVNEHHIPTGDIQSVGNTVFDFRQRGKIGVNIDAPEVSAGKGFDNTWVLEKTHTPAIKFAASVFERLSGRVMRVDTTEPSLHFYSANFIQEGTAGKDNAVYGRRHAFCLETQHFPDAPNHAHFPSVLLLPGKKFNSQTIFNFSTD